MQQRNIESVITGIINGDVSNGYKRNELFDANAVIDIIRNAANNKPLWEFTT